MVGLKKETFGANDNVVVNDLYTPEMEIITGLKAGDVIAMGTILGRVDTVGELVVVTDANRATITQYYINKRAKTVASGATVVDAAVLAMGVATKSLTNIADLTDATLIELDMNRTGLFLVSSN